MLVLKQLLPEVHGAQLVQNTRFVAPAKIDVQTAPQVNTPLDPKTLFAQVVQPVNSQLLMVIAEDVHKVQFWMEVERRLAEN